MRPAFGIGSGTPYEAATWENNVAATPAVSQHPARLLASRWKLGCAGANPDQQAASLKDETLRDLLFAGKG